MDALTTETGASKWLSPAILDKIQLHNETIGKQHFGMSIAACAQYITGLSFLQLV